MLLTNFLVSGLFGGPSFDAGMLSPPFLAEGSAVLPCFAFFAVLASPKTTLLSMSSLLNGMFDFLAARLPFLGMLGIGTQTQKCMMPCVAELEPRLSSSIKLSETTKRMK